MRKTRAHKCSAIEPDWRTKRRDGWQKHVGRQLEAGKELRSIFQHGGCENFTSRRKQQINRLRVFLPHSLCDERRVDDDKVKHATVLLGNVFRLVKVEVAVSGAEASESSVELRGDTSRGPAVE